MGSRKRSKELRETVASGDTHPHKKTRYACIVEAHESTRGNLLFREITGITSQRIGFNSLTHYNLVHRFIPMPQAMKIPDAKAAVNED